MVQFSETIKPHAYQQILYDFLFARVDEKMCRIFIWQMKTGTHLSMKICQV